MNFLVDLADFYDFITPDHILENVIEAMSLNNPLARYDAITQLKEFQVHFFALYQEGDSMKLSFSHEEIVELNEKIQILKRHNPMLFALSEFNSSTSRFVSALNQELPGAQSAS